MTLHSRRRLPWLLPLFLFALAGCGNIENSDPKPRIDTASTPGTAYGNTLLGTRKQLDFVLRNSDSGFAQVDPLKDIVVSVTGTGLTLTHTCPGVLNEGESCFITVFYLPPSASALTGGLSVASNAKDGPVTLPLSGAGVTALDPAQGAIAFASTPQPSFGTVTVGQSVTLTYTLNNIGNAGDALTIAGPTETGWSFDRSNCPDVLAQASSCNVSVTFAPTTTGFSVPSRLLITDSYNTDYGGLSVSLSGTGG